MMYVLEAGRSVEDLFGYLVALGAGGIIIEGIRGWRQKRKMGADYADVISQSAVRLLEPLEHRIVELEEDLDECRKQLRAATKAAEQMQREAQKYRRAFQLAARRAGNEQDLLNALAEEEEK